MIMIVMMIMAMIRSTCLIIWWQSSMLKKSKTCFDHKRNGRWILTTRERGARRDAPESKSKFRVKCKNIQQIIGFHLEQVKHSKPVFSGCARRWGAGLCRLPWSRLPPARGQCDPSVQCALLSYKSLQFHLEQKLINKSNWLFPIGGWTRSLHFPGLLDITIKTLTQQ